MTDKKTAGNFGEDIACEYIKKRGMKIIKRNFYCRTGEIDIIAADGEYTVFIEVKTRKNSNYGTPGEFVDYYKQQKIIKAAQYYAAGSPELYMRFDVCEVYYHTTGNEYIADKVNYIENAFC